MRVHDASDSLRTLITLVGLADILLADDAPLVTYRRRSEQSERRDQFLARERSTRADPHDSSGVAPPPGGS
jgi:hypothetical protein